MSFLKTFSDTLQLRAYQALLERKIETATAITKSRHLALFAWALPPNSNAGVFRPLSFIKYSKDRGWKISAFHGTPPVNQSQCGSTLLHQIPPSTTLECVPPSNLQPSYRLTPQIDGGFPNAVELARRAIRTLGKSPPAIVAASGPPFYTFVAARYVARYFAVPFVLDYRDEWSECPFDFVSRNRDNRAWEKRCLADADAVVFTTASHLDHQVRVFRELARERAHLIPNGWDADDFDAAQLAAHSNQRSNTTITLSHIGTLSGHNLPNSFLEQVAAVLKHDQELRRRLIIRFIGRRSSDADNALTSFPYPGNIQIIDHVDKQDANRLMIESDALLLISSPGLERYLPGKLFDYVAARRPILVTGVPGETTAVVSQLEAGAHALDTDGLEKAIHRLQDGFNLDPEKIESWLHHHRRDVLANQFFDLLDGHIRSN